MTWYPRKRSRGSDGFVPRLETLEDRFCPAASINITGSTMTITGENIADTVTINDNGSGGVEATLVNLNGTVNRTGANIKRVVIRTLDGTDDVTYNLEGSLTTRQAVTLDTGRDGDIVTLNFNQTISAELCLNVNTGTGNDQVSADFGAITARGLAFSASLGSGDDKFDANLNGNLSDRTGTCIGVFGGDGGDQIAVSAEIDIAQRALVGVVLDGGNGGDTIEFGYQGLLNGNLAVALNGGSDNDILTNTLTAEAGSSGRLHSTVLGGNGDDTLTHTVTNNSGGTLKILSALADGGRGTDSLTRTANVKAKNIETDIVLP